MKNVRCPHCKNILFKENNSLKCALGHTYDISKYNYINFLSNGKVHGDNKEMVLSRRAFLDSGFYEKLRIAINDTIHSLGNIDSYLDAGCGEGYYTQGIFPMVNPETSWGIDISKDALIYAHKRIKDINLAVGSVYDMSFFSDSSFDVVTSIFSPFAEEEIHRVLKNNGYLISVIPGENHLFALKEIIYDNPYKNDVKSFQQKGFEFIRKIDVDYEITVNKENAEMLWKMTPYYYRTPKSGLQRLLEIDFVKTQVSFHVILYKALKEE